MLDDDRLRARLDGDDDPLVRPIGVAWLPPEHRGRRHARFRHLRHPARPVAPEPVGAAQDPALRARPLRGRRRRAGPGQRAAPPLRRRLPAAPSRTSSAARRTSPSSAPSGPSSASSTRSRSSSSRRSRTPTASATAPRELADDLELDRGEVLDRAKEGLGEMVASQSRAAIDLWDQFGRFLARAHRITVDDSRIDELRDLGRRHSLIFLPEPPLLPRPARAAAGAARPTGCRPTTCSAGSTCPSGRSAR